MLVWLQSRSGPFEGNKKIFAPAGIRASDRILRSVVTIATVHQLDLKSVDERHATPPHIVKGIGECTLQLVHNPIAVATGT